MSGMARLQAAVHAANLKPCVYCAKNPLGVCGFHLGRELREVREGAKKKPPRGLA